MGVYAHLCERRGCAAWGCYGFGSLRRGGVTWRCAAHRGDIDALSGRVRGSGDGEIDPAPPAPISASKASPQAKKTPQKDLFG